MVGREASLAKAYRSLAAGLAIVVLQGFLGDPSAWAHPLDPLSSEEIVAATDALRQAGDTDETTRFALIDLDEPDKSAVLAWRPGQPFVRRAFVIARQRSTVYEGVVDLTGRKVERWQPIPNAQSGILSGEWEAAQQIATSDPGWQAAMRRRGYDPSHAEVFCAPLAAGYFADPAEKGRRLLRVACFDTAGTSNVWARPIEGLLAVVDLDANRIVRLIDTGPVQVSRDPGRFDEASQKAPRPALKPVLNEAPAGPNFALDRNSVQWNRWSFHYRMDPRTGLILSLVRYQDQGRERMVLYRGSVAEMFVPYMDPAPNWSFRTSMDVGEYGFGPLSLPLSPGSDCPANAAFLDAVLADETGSPVERKGVICLFERATAAPLWRHAEIVNNGYEGRPAVELVMRTIPSVGNYDYLIDWVLTEAGATRIDVGATGIDEVKGVRSTTMADPTAANDTAYGTLVAPNLVAVNHDHFLSFRLDVDIDGEGNTLVRQRLAPQRMNAAGGRRSLWRVVDEPVGIEGPLHSDMHGGAEIWRIENPNRTNPLGQHPGYELRVGHSVVSLLAADDFPQRRAGFSGAPLWVTAYDPTELYAGGMYPNQSRGGDGLPAFVARHRPVANADLVLWYTMGFHHVPRPEDWPVLPTMWHTVSLVPYGFFDHNPALDLPRDFAPPTAGR
jgi:primary-amine oxidase